jgi:hypothetical protein
MSIPQHVTLLWCAVIENNSIKGVHEVRCFTAWKQKQRWLLHCHDSLKNHTTENTPSPKKSVNFSHALFSLLNFLKFEDSAHRLSWNFGKELPLYTNIAELTWWFGDAVLGLVLHGLALPKCCYLSDIKLYRVISKWSYSLKITSTEIN